MKTNTLTLLLSALLLPFGATYAAAVPYSPYADITINTHWDSQTQSMQPMALDQIATKNHIKSYHLAFIVDKGQCNPAWAGQYTLADNFAKPLTDRLHAKGIDTIISFGGAAGNDLSRECSQHDLTTSLETIASRYHAKGLDFDIENGTTDVPNLIAALADYQATHPTMRISFTLPVLPEGLTNDGIDVITQARDAGLKFSVNIMAMDYGPYYSGDMGEYAIQAATAVHTTLANLYPNQDAQSLWQLIEVTPMIGVNDVNTEQFTLANADALFAWANTMGLGRLGIWSIARDKPCDSQWASPICSGANLQTQDYEFSQHFTH